MSDDVLLTGATGYVGRYLLRTWLETTDQRIHLIARSRPGMPASSRVERSLREIDHSHHYSRWVNRLTIHEGDVSDPRLALPEPVYHHLADNIAEIIHCAAAARFDLSLDEARHTNVGSVENVLRLAATCTNFKRLHYVGTAYVAGKRSGRILESELDVGQDHRNTYERSKFEAEKLLRQRMPDLPITIYRPSIVICDSRTGMASDHNGFYRVLAMHLRGGLPLLPGDPTSPLDLVPVDYVCEAIRRIAGHPNSSGECYHITAGLQGMTTLNEIRDLCSQYSGHPKFELLNPEAFAAFLDQAKQRFSAEELKPFEELLHYSPYVFCNLWFDQTNTLRDAELQAPPLRGYFHRFVERILTDGTGPDYVSPGTDQTNK